MTFKRWCPHVRGHVWGVKGTHKISLEWSGRYAKVRMPACLPACLPTCLPACLPAYLPACLPATAGIEQVVSSWCSHSVTTEYWPLLACSTFFLALQSQLFWALVPQGPGCLALSHTILLICFCCDSILYFLLKSLTLHFKILLHFKYLPCSWWERGSHAGPQRGH